MMTVLTGIFCKKQQTQQLVRFVNHLSLPQLTASLLSHCVLSPLIRQAETTQEKCCFITSDNFLVLVQNSRSNKNLH